MWREANLWRGAILSPIPGEGGLQPIVCCQPARSSKGGFSGVSPGCFLAVSPGCFLAVSPGCFSGCVARLFSGCVTRLFFWLCRQVVVLAVSPGFVFLAVSPGLLLNVSSGGFWLVLPEFVFLTLVSVS